MSRLLNSINFILASSSQYRQAQFSALGINCATMAPNVDETAKENEPPRELAERLSHAKAQTIANQYPESIVIASDQVACLGTSDGTIMGKPHTHNKAIEQLTLCSGQEVVFYSALTVMHRSKHCNDTRTEITRVNFRQLSAVDILRYLSKEKPYDCAGSFKVEGLGTLLFESIHSRDPNALIGLPVMLLREMLSECCNIDLLELAANA